MDKCTLSGVLGELIPIVDFFDKEAIKSCLALVYVEPISTRHFKP